MPRYIYKAIGSFSHPGHIYYDTDVSFSVYFKGDVNDDIDEGHKDYCLNNTLNHVIEKILHDLENTIDTTSILKKSKNSGGLIIDIEKEHSDLRLKVAYGKETGVHLPFTYSNI